MYSIGYMVQKPVYEQGDSLECIKAMQVEVNWGDLIYTEGKIYRIETRHQSAVDPSKYRYMIESDGGIIYQFSIENIHEHFKFSNDYVGQFDYAMGVI